MKKSDESTFISLIQIPDRTRPGMKYFQPSFAALVPDGARCWRGPRLPKSVRDQPVALGAELVEFQRRAVQRGSSPTSTAIEVGKLRALLAAAERKTGSPLRLLDLARDPALLTAACCDARRRDGKAGQLKRTTLHGHRGVARRFLRLMEDWIGIAFDILGPKLETELHAYCELPAAEYRFRCGDRERSPRYTPSRVEFDALLRDASMHARPFGAERDVAFLMLLGSTGLRISSAVGVDGHDFYRTGSTLWLSVREKAKREPQQVRIAPEVGRALEQYVSACNGHYASSQFEDRIGIGVNGTFWRLGSGRPFGKAAATMMLRSASRRVCSEEFGPHAIRRFVVRALGRNLSRSTVAAAMRWKGTATPDLHYAAPPGAYLISPSPDESPERRNPDEPAEPQRTQRPPRLARRRVGAIAR